MKPIHAVLMALGSHGDNLPMIGLGRALVARGHRVTLLINEHFKRLGEAAGLDLLILGTDEDYQAALQRPNLHHPFWGLLGVSNLIFPHFPHIYRRLQEAVERYAGPTVLVGTSLCFPMLCLKEKSGLPAVVVHLAPALLRSSWSPPQLFKHSFDLVAGLETAGDKHPCLRRIQYYFLEALWRAVDFAVADWIFSRPLSRFRGTLGLGPVKRVLHHYMHSGDLVLGLFPDWFCPQPADWPRHFHHCSFPLYDQEVESPCLSPELETFLAAGEPPIVFTGGTAFPNLKRFYQESAKACQILGQRGLLVTRYPRNIPDPLPDGVMAVPYAPFSLLFERCKVIVHHGGIGTTSQAIRAGVPQLIQPMAFDQFDNSARCSDLGVATWLTTTDYRAARVAARLRELTAPYFAANARRLADRLRQTSDPFQLASEHIETLARQRA